jgi:voltage-gated potassium channel
VQGLAVADTSYGRSSGKPAGTRPFYRELPNGRIEHRAEPVILVLALLVIPAFLLEQGRSDWVRDIALGLNTFIWIGFAFELVFVLAVSGHRIRTLKAHWLEGSIVLVGFPVMPAGFQGTLALRALRFVRLGLVGARILVRAPRLFRPASLPYIALLVGLLVIVSGTVMSEVDSDQVGSVGEGIWWALVTVTTVGYGDITPESPGGRVLAALVMGVGIGFYAVLTATIAATFVGQEERAEDQELRGEMREISERLERIERMLERGRRQP